MQQMGAVTPRGVQGPLPFNLQQQQQQHQLLVQQQFAMQQQQMLIQQQVGQSSARCGICGFPFSMHSHPMLPGFPCHAGDVAANHMQASCQHANPKS